MACGVLMFAVTCIDHNRVGVFRNALRRTARAHGIQTCLRSLHRWFESCLQALAFTTDGGTTHIQAVRREALLGQFKRRPRTR